MFELFPIRMREKLIKKLQYSLGIGSGSFVNDSGEEKVIKIASSTFTPQNAPLYIFDVGANVGKYTSLCLEHLNGGGQVTLKFIVSNLLNILSTYSKTHILTIPLSISITAV